MPHQPTIRDIAAACGVHYSTVSLALRKDPRILPQTVEKVQAAAARLGYRPDPSIALLMTRIRSGKQSPHRETLAWITCPAEPGGWRKSHVYSGFHRGALAKAQTLGYRLDLIEDPTLIRSRLYEVLRARGIRGVVFSTLFEVSDVGNFDWDKIAAVQVEPHDSLPLLPTVSNDQTQIVREAFFRARSLGYRRIGIAMNGVWDVRIRNAWLSGYLTDSYALPRAERLEPFDVGEWSRESFAKWLKKQKPDVILTVDRRFVWRWLAELNLKVPQDIAYIELDLPDTAPQFAGMRQNHEAVGAAAISLLVSRLYHNETGPDGSRMTTRIEGSWHSGATAPPRR